MDPIIIIGAGMAGYTVARELRKLDKTVPLTIITADHGGFYSKPMLSNALAQKKTPGQLVNFSALQMAAQLNAPVLARTRVDSIDSKRRTITTSAGEFGYGKLVLAVGAQAIRLSIAGNGADQVLSINHLEDYAAFRDRLALVQQSRSARVTILGAGLIGCEFADDLSAAGYAVTLVDPNPLPLAALAAPALSQGLQAALTKQGVTMHLGTSAAEIDRSAHGLCVSLANGTSFDTDIVLSAVGLRPDLTLARNAGLAVGRGVLLDATGQSSAPGIYALGDCAEYTLPDARTGTLPYIAPLMTAARAIARSLAGDATTIDLKPAAVVVKTPSYPLALMPPSQQALEANGQWHVAIESERTICRYRDAGGMLQGFGVAPQEAGIRAQLLAELGRNAEQEAGPKAA
jgi:rubredoxin-NAD+ reductase